MKNVEDGGHLLFSIFLFLTSLTKKLAQLSAVLDLWEYKGCEMGVSCPFSVLFFPNVLDLRLREKEHFLHVAIGTPGSSEKHRTWLASPDQSVFHIRRGHMVSWHL